ncbi:unnamed protein product, partial [Mesorhabditis belari]|uniref:Uncharacterized protein n=1 Tax=Mesorhabditis belari TaxID=2138241 RepID=A0AAF3F315_9BILA
MNSEIGLDLRPKGGLPTSEELLVLLEKQDVMLESLMLEVQTCREEVDRLKRENIQIERDGNQARSDQMETGEKLREAINLLDIQKNLTTDLEKEIEKMRHDATLMNPVGKVLEFEAKTRELEFSLDREKRSTDALKNEIHDLKRQKEELKSDLENSWEHRKDLAANLNEKMEILSRELTEEKIRNQAARLHDEELNGKMKAELEILKERENFFETHNKQLAQDVQGLRKERAVMMNRIKILNDENVSLRTKVLRFTGDDDLVETNKGETKAFEKLISDQAHLIAALREECKLLANKLEDERKEYRSERKISRKEKKELEQRLERLLLIEKSEK